jgi:putative PEP-CTERM system integral membrane protein
MKLLFHGLLQAIFWGWNLTFLAIAYLGILPFVGIPLVEAVINGDIPLDFFFTLVALVAIPTLSTAIAAIRFYNRPLQLMRLFYCVEAPLFLLCLVRLFLIRELTPASAQVFASLGIVIFAFLGELLFGYAVQRRAVAWMQMLAHSLMLLVGVYAGSITFFYAVPIAVWIIKAFFSFEWVGILWQSIQYDFLSAIWWVPLFLVFWGISCSLFVVLPSVMTSQYFSSGRRILKAFGEQYGKTRAWAGMLGVFSATILIFVSLQQQPQAQAFKLLDSPAQSDRDRQSLLEKSETIRAGLVNAYLSKYRYLSTTTDNDHIKTIYQSVFNFPEHGAQNFQNAYNLLMSPFLYRGERGDIPKAATLYAEFFDTSIQKGEKDAINHALESTYNRDEAKAGLLNLNQEKVWLRSQEINLKENGNWADIELHEVYENKTNDTQEVFYSFSLPESAVITGLWLGNTADLNNRFNFLVSPRGAAQQVYNDQVRWNIDPALLEQVGPRHYRLRAFPVPPRQASWQRTEDSNSPTEMHLWLTYKVMQQEKGWALPQLGEKRNIYWTQKTKRLRNGKDNGELDDWVEAYLPASSAYRPQLQTALLTNNYQITAKPLSDRDYTLPKEQRFAIAVDTSLSMKERVKELGETFDWLKKNGFANKDLSDNDADLYVISAGMAAKRLDDFRQFDPAKITFYGTVQLKEMLQQFEQLRGDTKYNGILLVTDEGSYELSNDKKTLKTPSAPLWMVHLGSLPPAYDDVTLKAIENSGGGVSTELSEVLRRLATKSALGDSTVSVVDGYAWSIAPTNAETKAANSTFDPLAARQLVLGLSQEKNLDSVVELDAIHAIAKNYKIVTPYSSMIVLVNDEQKRQLQEAEKKSDRFDREVESGHEELNQPFDPMDTTAAIPEPSQVAGVILAAFGLGWVFVLKQRRRKLNWK